MIILDLLPLLLRVCSRVARFIYWLHSPLG